MSFVFNVYPWTLSLTRDPSSFLRCGRGFARAWGCRPAFLQVFIQSNGQCERANQVLEATLRCVSAKDPTTWVEYSHNHHTCSATGPSPFEVSLGYQPPLFPAQRKNWQFHPYKAAYAVEGRCHSGHPGTITRVLNELPTSTGPQPQSAVKVSQCGFPPGTFHYLLNPGSSLLALLDHSLLRESSVHPL